MTSSMLAQLEQRADTLRRDLHNRLSAAEMGGRTSCTASENAAFAEYQALRARCAELRAESKRAAGLSSNIQARFGGDQPTSGTAMRTTTRVNDSHLVYRKNGRQSWLRDLVLHHSGSDDTGECRNRLAAHANEVASDQAFMEYRDISRVDGSGGYAVPPAWLVDQYIELARPGRAFANLVQRQPLPGGTDSINIPKLLTGTTVGIQTADNEPVSDTDLTDTFVTAPVRTIAGQEGISIQLIDQSPIAFDDVVFRDLVAAHAAATDLQVLNGTGSTGQVLGVNLTPNIGTIAAASTTVQGVYSAIANAIQLIHTTRFLPPEVIVMHPRRWGALLASFDDVGRPLFIPNAQGVMNAGGVLTDVDSQCVVGTMQGLPIVTDPNITTTAGDESGGGDEDVIYVMRASDSILWESGIRARVLPETKASNLTVICQVYSYLAYTSARFPQSIVTITGLSAPTF